MSKVTKRSIAEANLAVTKASKSIIVIEWYDKDTIESILDRKLSNYQYKLIVDNISDYFPVDTGKLSSAVEDLLNECSYHFQNPNPDIEG
jgi:hypothetical protein